MPGPIVMLPYRDDELQRRYANKMRDLLSKPRLIDVNAAAENRAGGGYGDRGRGTSTVTVGTTDGSQWDSETLTGYLIPDDNAVYPRSDADSGSGSIRDIGWYSLIEAGTGYQAQLNGAGQGFQCRAGDSSSSLHGFESIDDGFNEVKLFYASGTGNLVAGYTAALDGDTCVGVSAVVSGTGSNAVVGTLSGTADGENDTYSIKANNRTLLGNWADTAEQGSAPATPPSGYGRWYSKDDGKAYFKNDGGTEYDLTATGGAASLSIHSVADADYTASTSDNVILYTSLSATRTVSLPAASSYGSGAVVIVKDGSGSAAFATNITIDADGSETIDGAGTKKITSAYGSLTLLTNGSNWFII